MALISISGRIHSGKDEVGKIIQYLTSTKNKTISYEQWLNTGRWVNHQDWQIKKFADKLKDIVCILLSCTREQLESQEFKEKELGEEWEMPLQEEWKDIIGYESLYEISNFGRVKSLHRLDSMGRVVEETIKAQHLGSTGYPAITLNKEGKKKTKAIHQLVVESFLGHIPDNYNGVVNHLDNVKTNNRLDNLEVVSSRYNTQYSKTTQGVYERRGRFEVYMRIDGKKTYLGSYITKEKALEVRNTKLKEIDTFVPLKYVSKQWTPRLLLQVMGTQIGRQIIHPNIWVNALMREYKPYNKGKAHTLEDWSEVYNHASCKNCGKSYKGWKRQNLCKECIEDDSIQFYPNWIITDARFSNEIEAVKERNGIIIKIVRGDNKVEGNEHESETSLDSYPFENIIENNGTILELIEKVKVILEKYKIL